MRNKEKADICLKYLRKGKAKFNGKKIILDELASKSAKESMISFLSKLSVSEGNVEVDKPVKEKVPYRHLMTNMDGVIQSSYVSEVKTIVALTDKSNKSFDFRSECAIGDILRTSNLGLILKKLKSHWATFANKDTTDPIVMYIPDVFVFLDPDKGIKLQNPFRINVVIVSESSDKRLKENMSMDVKNPKAQIMINTIADICDAMILLDEYKFVVQPIFKDYSLDIMDTIEEAWAYMIYESTKSRQIFDEIIFAGSNIDENRTLLLKFLSALDNAGKKAFKVSSEKTEDDKKNEPISDIIDKNLEEALDEDDEDDDDED
jgi:hypothetical protein